MRFLPVTLTLLLAGLPLQSVGDEPRVFEFTYEIMPGELPAGEAVDIYIPLPAEHADQRILEQALQSSVPGRRGVEISYGNAYYHITRPAGSDAPISAGLRWTVIRNTVRAGSE